MSVGVGGVGEVCISIDLHITSTNVKTMKDHLKFGLDVEANDTPTHAHSTHIKNSRNGSLLPEPRALKRAEQGSQPVVK